MNRTVIMWLAWMCFSLLALAALVVFSDGSEDDRSHLEPYQYEENFEDGELKAWASYPPNQDTAYDPYLYPGKIRPDDPGTCLVCRNEPPWNETQLLGAVKLLDFHLDRNFELRFRFFLKTVDRSDELAVHLPLADGRRLIYSIPEPPANTWTEIEIRWEHLVERGLISRDEPPSRVTALAVTARVPKADPSVPIHLGLDDIRVRGMREKPFHFLEPEVVVLAEWPERIPRRHYSPGGVFRLRGRFDFAPDTVRLAISRFSDRNSILWKGRLARRANDVWTSGNIQLSSERFPPGLYHGTVAASIGTAIVSRTEFTLLIDPGPGRHPHPRLIFAREETGRFRERFSSERFRSVRERFLSRAKSFRDEITPEKLVFDIDQFPDRDWVVSLPAWYKDRFMAFREALFTNAVVRLAGLDADAGSFVRALLLQLSGWPQWNHPWMEKRGFHTYYPLGEFAEAFSLAYDAVFDELTETERKSIREGLLRNYIRPAFRTYVEHNQVTSNSSNWISHIAGGALLGLMAIAWDDPELGDLEPWLTGFILKENKYITTVFGRDGSYGEGFRYYNFAMQSFAKTIPALKRIFGLDLSGPFLGSHQETLWSSIVQKNLTFGFGDTESYLKQEAQAWWIGGENGPMNSWAWLLELSRDASLAWLYTTLKEFDTLQEILHETGDVMPGDPARLGTVRFFPDVGTAVFRSGWMPEDFLFVFRSGPFFNHQHMDQGSFALVDRGEIFLEERYDGEHHYYDDPVYRSHAIQPISHNTILVNRNPQSQKVGDPKGFAAGMTDQARLIHWLDARDVAFVAGRLEKVYLDRIEKIQRNILFLKPRFIFLVDEIAPAGKDLEINRLFHTRWKKDIQAGTRQSRITKAAGILHLIHLAPETALKEVLAEPHFLYQYAAHPLIERGYLQISARTEQRKLVFADLMTATSAAEEPPFHVESHGLSYVVRHRTAGNSPAIVLNLGPSASFGDWSSDALLLSFGKEGEILLAGATKLTRKDGLELESDRPLYGVVRAGNDILELEANQEEKTTVILSGMPGTKSVLLDGRPVKATAAEPSRHGMRLTIPPGPCQIRVSNR